MHSIITNMKPPSLRTTLLQGYSTRLLHVSALLHESLQLRIFVDAYYVIRLTCTQPAEKWDGQCLGEESHEVSWDPSICCKIEEPGCSWGASEHGHYLEFVWACSRRWAHVRAEVTMDHYTVLDHWFGQDVVLGASGSWDLRLLIAWMSPSWSLQRMSGNLAIPWVWRKRLRRNSFESRKMFHLLDELQWSLGSFHLQNTFWLGRMAFFSYIYLCFFNCRFKIQTNSWSSDCSFTGWDTHSARDSKSCPRSWLSWQIQKKWRLRRRAFGNMEEV